MEALWQDVRYALRGFRKSLGFTLAAIFALALGIGANTAMFSVVNAVLLNSRAIASLRDPGRLAMVWEKNPKLASFIAARVPTCIANFREWRKQSQSFKGIAAYQPTAAILTAENDTRGSKPEQVDAAAASANFFPLLGVAPQLGRNFTADETQPGKGQVAILSNDLYKSRFQSDPHILGKIIRANDREYRIIGVLPAAFEMPAMWEGLNQPNAKFWAPLDLSLSGEQAGARNLFVYGRLKPGVTLAQARAEMDVIGKRLENADPELNAGFGVNVFPLRAEDVSPQLRQSLTVLQIAVGFVLLIACANVANLLLTRAVRREREIAVRVALGAAKSRIVRQMLSESVLLSLGGGIVGLLLALAALRGASVLAPTDTHGFHELRIDPLVLGFTVLVTMAAGLLFGLAPAFHASKQSINEALGHGSRAVGAASNRLRSALVISEVALSLILLIGAGLMIRSLERLMSADMGFRLDHLLTMRISLPETKYPAAAQVASFDDRLLEQVRQLSGIQAATLTDALPLQSVSEASYGLDGAKPKPGEELITDVAHVSDGYVEALGPHLYWGRTFSHREVIEAQPVALVNQSFARQNWPHQDAIGKGVYMSNDEGKSTRYSVIGIVGNEHQFGPEEASHNEVYLPRHGMRSGTLVARTVGDPLAMASAVEKQIWAIDKDQPVSQVESMERILREWSAPRRFNMTVLLNFAAIALVLAGVGLYAVLAYSVGLRTREIGVRMALGAEPGSVASFIVRQGLKLTAAGVALGLAGAFMLTRFLRTLIFGVSAMDPATFAAVTVALVLVAILASYLPARRASRIDPMQALRAD